VTEHDCAEHDVLGKLLGFRLDHQNGVAGAGDDEVELGFRHFVDVRVKHVLAVDIADAGAADRAHEGHARQRQGRRGGDNRQDVRVVLEVMLDDGDDDLRVVLVAIGKERTDRTIDEAGDQRLLLARATFALEVAAGNLAGSVGLFLVVDGQWEEVEARLRLLGRDDGGENDRLAIGGEYGSVGLTGDLAGFEDKRTSRPLDFHFVVIEHVLSFICGKVPRHLSVRGRTFPASFLGQPRARQREVWTFSVLGNAPGILQSCPMTCPMGGSAGPVLRPNLFGD